MGRNVSGAGGLYCSVGPYAIVSLAALLGQHPHLQQRIEDLPVQQLVPQLAVEALRVSVLSRRPGSMYSVLAPTFPSHSRTALAVNSGPLSERMWADTPRAIINSASVSMTSGDRMLHPARIARHSLEYSSMTVSSRKARPSRVLN